VEYEWGFDPLAFLVVLVLGLLGALVLARRLRAEGLERVEARWLPARRRPGWLALGALTLLASAPLVPALFRFAAEGASLPGDTAAHAQVAREIAEQGLPHGWIASYSAGFPFGPHYQSGALLVTAALIRAGLSPLGATHLVGLGATLLVPLLFLYAGLAAGARPAAEVAVGPRPEGVPAQPAAWARTTAAVCSGAPAARSGWYWPRWAGTRKPTTRRTAGGCGTRPLPWPGRWAVRRCRRRPGAGLRC